MIANIARFRHRLLIAAVVRFQDPRGATRCLFLRDALKEVKREGFTLAFEGPPSKGEKIVVIWWMAQE